VTGAAIELFWLPLGAGGHSVRFNGHVYEALRAARRRRRPLDIYHAALEIRVDGERFVIEMAPVLAVPGAQRGVVAEGAVGDRRAGRLRLFRYEVRRWRDGVIPDVDEAVGSPRRISDEPRVARRLLDLVPDVPTYVWGRDEIGAEDMWNSNSVIAWLLVRSGAVAGTGPKAPEGGCAPGWNAGVVAARRGLHGPPEPAAASRGLRRALP
jgi:hypothetical protein